MPEKTITYGKKHDVMKCVKYLLNLFGGRNINCLRQTTFHEPIGVKYQKKIISTKLRIRIVMAYVKKL